MTATGQIPVDRSGGHAAGLALQAAVGIVERGGVWGIHPEGTRSPDGRLHRGRTGVMRVAMTTGAPVLPVAIAGTNLPWWRRRVTITIAAPLDLSPYTDDAAGIRAATDALMTAIAAAGDQEAVEHYARRRDETAA